MLILIRPWRRPGRTGTVRGAHEPVTVDMAAGLKATRTGITFSPRIPIPDDLVERLARASRKDAEA